MHKKISSTFTFLNKFVFPCAWCMAPIIFFIDDSVSILHCLVWVIGAIGLYFYGIPLKIVCIDEFELIISNYLKQIRVPLSDIENVSNSYIFFHTVEVRLKTLTEFGEKIIFMPKLLMRFFPFMPHPVVKELKELSINRPDM